MSSINKTHFPKAMSESPLSKVIFLQKTFRFAGRTAKDLVIINFVCKVFEETMQAHHTFNLVLYDNIIKTQKEDEDFLQQQIKFLSKAPAWIVYQWTIVNEHDKTQRELLKAFLLYQAEDGNEILIRDRSLVSIEEDPSTSHELLRHILDSCGKLGIAKEVLEVYNDEGWNCIMQAVSRKISTDSFKLLIEFCVQYGVDVKKLLERITRADWNCIMLALDSQLPFDTFKFLLDSCVQHGVDMKKMLEQRSGGERNSIMLASWYKCPVDCFKLLFESCVQHGVDMKTMLEQNDRDDSNCIMLAVGYRLPFDSFKLLLEACVQHGADMKEMLEHQDSNCWSSLSLAAQCGLDSDSFKLLIAHFPSNESFRAMLAAEDWHQKRVVDHATTQEVKAFLKDPDCWQKCREWRKQQQQPLEEEVL